MYYNPYGSLITGICEPDNYENCYVNSATDDDTSIEWVDLWMLENYGLDITNEKIRQSWLSHINSGIFFANKWAYNLMTGNWNPSLPNCSAQYTCIVSDEICNGGCVPPYSGKKNYNPYFDYIDSQIEIEVFGVLSPGMKNVAGNYADKFARVTNDDYAIDYAKFYAMMYSEAFFENDVEKIIENVKAKFPQNSRVHEIVNDVKNWHDTYSNWRDTRQRIYNKYYVQERTTYGNGRSAFWIHSCVNFASTIMSLLYSQDSDKSVQFDKGIQIAALAGWDNDCNAPTTTGLLGIIAGAKNIPDKWKSPIRDFYENTNRNPAVLGDDTITNIANRNVNLGEQIILANQGSKVIQNNKIVYKIKKS